MIHIEPFQPLHLPQVQALVNAHLSAMVPGWALPEAYIASKLQRDPGEYVVDPWIIGRTTLCAIQRQRVVGAAHLLRYGSGPEVSLYYQGSGEIDWFVAWPDAKDAAIALLGAAQQQLRAWGVTKVWADMGLLVGPFVGVPDVWPHISAALMSAGFRPDEGSDEAVYGGRLDRVAEVGAPPIAGLVVRRTTGSFGAHFTAILEGQGVGDCECMPDLTEGGALPALRGWAELTEMEVAERWRNRGIGTCLIQHAAAWLRLGRCDRIVLAVAQDDEAAGVDRFYQRCGWNVLVRQQKGWGWDIVIGN
jgi:GNAT superfamily N-acetyltransferase